MYENNFLDDEEEIPAPLKIRGEAGAGPSWAPFEVIPPRMRLRITLLPLRIRDGLVTLVLLPILNTNV